MRFETMGDPSRPAVLFFHAMGVTGESSAPVAECLRERYFCILPTSTVYCSGQRYQGKAEELRQLEDFLRRRGVTRLALVVSSSLGADLALAFLAGTRLPVDHAYFDGGQFAQIGRGTRRVMVPFLYLAIKSLAWSRGRTLRYLLWCDDAALRPYFVAAGQALRYGNLRRQMADSLVDTPFPPLPQALQRRCFFAFGSAEEHFKYRGAVMRAYPSGHFPVFRDYQHMQYQIQDPRGFAALLAVVMERGALPALPFLEPGEEGERNEASH